MKTFKFLVSMEVFFSSKICILKFLVTYDVYKLCCDATLWVRH